MAAGFAIRFERLKETTDRYRALADASDVVRELSQALMRRGFAILAVSQRLVPVDTGALRASGHVVLESITDRSVSVAVVYGGAAAPYALIVHENLQAHHPVGQAKYLEVAATAERQGTLAELAQAVRDFIAAKRSARKAA